MSVSLESESLEGCFGVVSLQIAKIIDCNPNLSEQDVTLTVNKIEQCVRLVDSQGIFSKNEEIDDVQTGSLKVVLRIQSSVILNNDIFIFSVSLS
jgi:hypothetical protein